MTNIGQGELGNKKLYDEIVSESRSIIHGEVRSFAITNSYLDVEYDDLLQDVCVMIWRHLDKVAKARNRGAYLRHLCRNTLIKSLTPHKRYKAVCDSLKNVGYAYSCA